MHTTFQKCSAEFLGTFWLTFGGCGSAVLAAAFPQLGIGFVGVALAFGLLFALQSAITLAPRGALAQRLYPWFYGGLFLDEKFNSWAFALWAPPLPAPQPAALPRLVVHASTAAPLNPAATGAAP